MKYIQFGIYLLLILSCNKQVSNNEIAPQNKLNKKQTNTKYVFKNPITFDSIKIEGIFMDAYKFYEIEKDKNVIDFDFYYTLFPDTLLVINPLNNTNYKINYDINNVLLDNINSVLYTEKPKSYDDFNPPLPITTYPKIYATFYKKNSVVSKQFLIAHDSIDYSDDFYKVIDFLYILQIKNIQNEDTKGFIKNYKW